MNKDLISHPLSTQELPQRQMELSTRWEAMLSGRQLDRLLPAHLTDHYLQPTRSHKSPEQLEQLMHQIWSNQQQLFQKQFLANTWSNQLRSQPNQDQFQ